VRIESISAGEGEKFARVVSSFKTELDKLGPLKPEEYQNQNVNVNKKEKKKAKLNEL